MAQSSGPPTRTVSLSESLQDARERGFVGRASQLAAFAEALDPASDVRVLLVHGPGGIGKTTLLDAFIRQARSAGRVSRYLDARDLECSAAAVSAAVGPLTGCTPHCPPVLVIDGYELLTPLDRWLREELVPALPAGTVTVLAGRSSPDPRWWLDPGWRRLVRVHELTELDRAESLELLARLGVSEPGREQLSAAGRGHPLALAMLAEASRCGPAPARLADVPDVVRQLCALIIDDVPDAAHRTGLATCAHATRTTEDLLARTVGARAPEVWRWLESRPYVRHGEVGLFLHDVVRELFEAEFAHRAPEAFTGLHRRVRQYFAERLADPTEPHPDRAAAEILLLHRRSPLSSEIDALREGGLLTVATARPEDHAHVLALVERFEGPATAVLARQWIEQQPQGLYVVRADGGIQAFALHVYLPTTGAGERDLVANAVLETIERHGPLRPGERVNIGRLSGAAVDYQRNPMTLLVNGVSSIMEWSSRAAAWTFVITIDPEHFGPYFEYLGMRRMFGLEKDGRITVGYGWDRRRLPVPAFMELMIRRELSGETGPPPADLLRPAPLSRPAFEAAVRHGLRELNRPDRLADSSLLGTGLIEVGAVDPVAALRASFHTAIAGLDQERRGQEHRRVLERSYVKGAPSQEAAAEVLGLPFSTYRRHLAGATERLIEVLWSIEVGGKEKPDG